MESIIDRNRPDRDYECALNPATLMEYIPASISDEIKVKLQCNAFADSYLHSADVLLLNFMNDQSDVYMPGIIFRACVMAVELKIKSLVGGMSHDLMKLMADIQRQFLFIGDDTCYVSFIQGMNDHAHGSETGRYPMDKQGNWLCRQQNGVLYIRIGQFVYLVHDLFDNYFGKLIPRSVKV